MQFYAAVNVSEDLVKDIARRMAELGLTQAELARACGLSQPHISRVLQRRLKLAKKTRERLVDWLAHAGPGDSEPLDAMFRLLQAKAKTADPRARMQIMQLLKALDGILELASSGAKHGR